MKRENKSQKGCPYIYIFFKVQKEIHHSVNSNYHWMMIEKWICMFCLYTFLYFPNFLLCVKFS